MTIKFSVLRLPGICCLVILTLFAPGCAQIAGTTPQAQVMSRLLSPPSRVRPASIVFLQEQTLLGHVFVLVEYDLDNSEGKITHCQALYDTFQDEHHAWFTFDSHLGCSPQGAASRTNWSAYGTGRLAQQGETVYSYIYGQIPDDSITTITATWEDGVSQTVGLNKQVYLSLRKGASSRVVVEEKDRQGKVIDTETFPP